jgi:hypothetical protein
MCMNGTLPTKNQEHGWRAKIKLFVLYSDFVR